MASDLIKRLRVAATPQLGPIGKRYPENWLLLAEAADALARSQADHDAVRREALEEAARIAESYERDRFEDGSGYLASREIADSIRSLIPASQPDIANPDGEGQDR